VGDPERSEQPPGQIRRVVVLDGKAGRTQQDECQAVEKENVIELCAEKLSHKTSNADQRSENFPDSARAMNRG
jgi:hypothetical protein